MGRQRTGCVNWSRSRKAWVARLDWVDEGGRKQCRKRQVTNKSEGQRLVKDWLRELEEQGQEYLKSDRVTFAEVAAEYEREVLVEPVYRDGKKVAGLRDWKGARNRLKYLVDYFGPRRVREITAGDLRKYRNHSLKTPTLLRKGERSVADVNRSLTLLRSVFGYAVEAKKLAANPFTNAKNLIQQSLETTRERVLSTDEQRRLLEACRRPAREHIYPLVLLALDSGFRRGELLGLTWKDLDLEKNETEATSHKGNLTRTRLVDLEPLTLAELRRLKERRGLEGKDRRDDSVFGLKSNFTKSLRSAMREAQIEGARFHDLRATAITTWLLRGMPVPFAMLRSGHTNPKTFQRYVRMSEDVRQKQRERLGEWELAASLSALASAAAGGLPQTLAGPVESALIN
jgi:integrase